MRKRLTDVGLVALALLTALVVSWGFIADHQRQSRLARESPPVLFTPAPQSPEPTASAATPTGPVAVFLSDSDPAQAPNDANWSGVVAKTKGWQEMRLGDAGIGYRTAGRQATCGKAYCPSFGELVPRVVDAKPAVVVIAGGRNDGQLDVSNASADLFKHLREALPNTRIVVVASTWDSNDRENDPTTRTANQLKRSAAATDKVEYLDLQAPLSGKAELWEADGKRPNQAGQQALGRAVAAAIR